METTSGELTDFCLVLTPDGNAAALAGEAVRSRFKFLAEATRLTLVAAVTERAEKLVERGAGRPIMVMIALENGTIHGEVTDRGEAEGGATGAGFEIALPILD